MKRAQGLTAALLAVAGLFCLHEARAEAPAPHGPLPSEAQVNWLRMEWYAFVHFGLNTWTDREWGYGHERPALFNPTRFDAGEIVSIFARAGMRGMIYTAKHHDGWCSWPTATTPHSIAASPWKDGKGDVVREFAEACRQHGIAFGTYLSPWDRNRADYGSPEYLQTYYAQVEELLSNYGPIFEIWFDGANGGDGYYGGACEKRNIGDASRYYDFERLVKTIRALQPQCIIWGAGQLGDVEWGGSEQGHVAYPLSNVCEVNGQLRWVSLEGDTPINRSGWFWHPEQQNTVKAPGELMKIYMESVGHGANLILNLAPNREGRLDAADVDSLLEFGELRRQLLGTDYALGARTSASGQRSPQFSADKLTDGDMESFWCPEDGMTTGWVEVQLESPKTFDVIRLREQIRLGQRVDAFEIDAFINGAWQTLDARGRSIGNQVMRWLPEPVTTDRVRVRITRSAANPCLSELSLLRMPDMLFPPQLARRGNELIIRHPQHQHVVYTLDGRRPTVASPRYTPGLRVAACNVVRAACVDAAGKVGPVSTMSFAYDKTDWMSESGTAALDDDPDTLWQASAEGESLVVDMKKELGGLHFTYLPRQDGRQEGVVDRYRVEISADGTEWNTVAEGEFSNIRANPMLQYIGTKLARGRYWRFTPLRTLDGSPATAAEIDFFPIASKQVWQNIHFNR